MRGWVGVVAVLVAVLVPSVARAQDGTIAGVVRDASGAVLPGVTVEASSPALIEKVRSVVTDGTGQYSIVALPPGAYTLTFTLARLQRRPDGGHPADRRHHRDASTPSFASAALEETVTVTGESPIVDIRSAQPPAGASTATCFRRLPTSRSYNDVLQLAPGVVAGNGQAQLRPGMLLFTAHGGNTQDGRLTRGRHQHRRVARRRGRVRLHPRHAERPGSHLHHLRQPRRGRDRRPADDDHPEVGRQHLQRLGAVSPASTTTCRATTTTTSS